MRALPFRLPFIAGCMLAFAISQAATAKTLCVNPSGSRGCYNSIQSAVNNASPYDVVMVATGVYHEEVDIGMPLSLRGAGAQASVIDAANLNHGVFVDGYDHPGLHDVSVSGFTVKGALYEGILVVSAWDVTIRNNRIVNNDTVPGLQFTGELTGCPGQPGNGTYETDESGDCGGALHLVGTAYSVVSGNVITGNADGVLISDETAESHHNLLTHNRIVDNPLECGIVLASHPPAGTTSNPAKHYGVDFNTIADNVSVGNGVQIGGAGVGIFSDGANQGRVSSNVIIHNVLNGNGLGGVSLHTHVGPKFGLPADDLNNNMIIGNSIAGNLADQFDTATPGRVGININSGNGGSPVLGTVISQNIIHDEDVDVAVNTPAEVDIHMNDLGGGKMGVANVCAFDHNSSCTGSIDATENFWGCALGPGHAGCSSASGAAVNFTPWLTKPVMP